MSKLPEHQSSHRDQEQTEGANDTTDAADPSVMASESTMLPPPPHPPTGAFASESDACTEDFSNETDGGAAETSHKRGPRGVDTAPVARPAPWATSTIDANNVPAPHSLGDIMQEQENERQEELTVEDLNLLEMQEEELLKYALEKSLSDIKYTSASSAVPDTPSRGLTTNLSSSDLFALKVQAEAERTEAFVDSPHGTTTTVSTSGYGSSMASPACSRRSWSTTGGSSRNSSMRRLMRHDDSNRTLRSDSGHYRVTPASSSQQNVRLHDAVAAPPLVSNNSQRRLVRLAAAPGLNADQVSQLERALRQVRPRARSMEYEAAGNVPYSHHGRGGDAVYRRRRRVFSGDEQNVTWVRNASLSPEEQHRRILRSHSSDGQDRRTLGTMQRELALSAPVSPLQRQSISAPALLRPVNDSVHVPSLTTASSPPSVSQEYDLRGAEEHLSPDELRQIQQALEQSEPPSHPEPSPAGSKMAALSAEEAAQIERALREADAAEEAKSLQLALQIQEEDIGGNAAVGGGRQGQGNVRTLSRAEFEQQRSRGSRATSRVGAFSEATPAARHPMEEAEELELQAGYRMNAQTAQQAWTRRGNQNVIGPNDEIRTKHDEELQALANAHRLGIDIDDPAFARVGNRAFNSFMQSVRHQKKGVAAHGTGRAGSDADGVRQGGMDANVRLQVTKAINSGLIENLNGIVKEGKEAIVYHADQGAESQGFDVALKVFKRIQEFRNRGEYVEGDPRYHRQSFKNAGSREQLDMWAEKEFRNLVRAHRGGVPVPTPLHYKDNTLFMRFLGSDGWPSPQLRELDLRKGSSRWATLYEQTMEAIMRLYKGARLVHGDLSEYNILVVPANMVDNNSSEVRSDDDLQIALIDFGQAVDVRHPEAETLLRRDLEMVLSFFTRHGISTMSVQDAMFLIQHAPDVAPDT